LLVFDAPVAYADNCGSLSDCFYTIAAALAAIAALALIIAGLIALPALLAALASGGGAGLALVGGGTLGGAATVPAAVIVASNIAAAAVAAAGAASDIIMQMSGEGTPGSNQAQNKQFRDAIRQAERDLGRNLSKHEIRQVHDEITGQNMGFHEIVETIIGMFGG
jgi:uncharacterized protein (UPF0261 family)